MALDRLSTRDAKPTPALKDPVSVKRVSDKTYSYVERNRGQWSYPEYDFDEIQIAQDADGYMSRSINKKVNRVIVAGWDLVGQNDETVAYIEKRFNEMAWATNRPFGHLIIAIFYDLFRFNNHVWIKARKENGNSGSVREDADGFVWKPIAGYFPVAFETLQFKSKPNGELKKVMQKMPSGAYKEFFPEDIVHFHTNRKPGFSVGTPELLPALDDIALLRRVEENVESLIEASLFPIFHYKVGSDAYPERYTPDGVKETDLVKATVEYMPSGGIYVSDHRHEVSVIGAEGQALRIDYYIQHFKSRVFASLGTSALDMGEGDSANKSTASTLSKGMLMDIEAATIQVKQFLEFFVIQELLLEGGYDPFDPKNLVRIRFGVIDKDERRADENQQIQLFLNNLRTMDEVRASLGDKPFTDEMLERTCYKMFTEPTALVKGMAAGSAAGETLAKMPVSNIEPEALNKEKAFAKAQQAEKKASNQPVGKPKTKTNGTTANRSRPQNQRGTRSSPKTNRDIQFKDGQVVSITCDINTSDVKLDDWKEYVYNKYINSDKTISLDTIAEVSSWRLKE
jgi:hypothetical protein